ncbi:hypothetical protein KU15F73_07670 [Escherichia coli]
MNQQLSWRTIVGYSLGDVANNFAFAMGALFLLSYYTDVAGVGAAAAAPCCYWCGYSMPSPTSLPDEWWTV